jgi:hypothetical protein
LIAAASMMNVQFHHLVPGSSVVSHTMVNAKMRMSQQQISNVQKNKEIKDRGAENVVCVAVAAVAHE